MNYELSRYLDSCNNAVHKDKELLIGMILKLISGNFHLMTQNRFSNWCYELVIWLAIWLYSTDHQLKNPSHHQNSRIHLNHNTMDKHRPYRMKNSRFHNSTSILRLHTGLFLLQPFWDELSLLKKRDQESVKNSQI